MWGGMTKSEFATASDGVRLGFERLGAGAPVLLVHGFGSSRAQNWKSTGWYGALTEAGYEVVAMDCRGHGQSDKPHDEASYGHARMAEDVIAVMDAAGLGAVHLVGYSMGGFIGIRLLAGFRVRVRSLSLGGVGEHYLTGRNVSSEGSRQVIAEALATEDKAGITDPHGRMFRDFADQPGKDRFALAACMRAMKFRACPQQLYRNWRRLCWWSAAKKTISPVPHCRWRPLSRMAQA